MYSYCAKKQAEIEERSYVTIDFLRSELLYDIGNYAWVDSDVMAAQSEHERHNVADILDDGNRDRVERVLERVFSEVVEILHAYTKINIEVDEKHDDTLEYPERYELRLRLPTNFSKTTLRFLKNHIHEFLVSSVLHDWMRATNPQYNGHWQEKKEEARIAISTNLGGRVSQLRRRPSVI